MVKKNYIQPELGTIILPQSALMAFNGSPGEGFNPQLAPQRRLVEMAY